MKSVKSVHGSAEQAQPIVVGKDTVYVHGNIMKVKDNLYCYDEIQYTLDEFAEVVRRMQYQNLYAGFDRDEMLVSINLMLQEILLNQEIGGVPHERMV